MKKKEKIIVSALRTVKVHADVLWASTTVVCAEPRVLVCACVFKCLKTLTVFAEAAQLCVLLPEDLLQPLGFVEVRETIQTTEQNFGQKTSPSHPAV